MLMMKKIHIKYAVMLVCLILAVVFLYMHMEEVKKFKEYLDKNINYGFFLILMTVLPILGFPISAFLVFSGIRFGIYYGLVSMAVTFPVHLFITIMITRSFLRPFINRFLKHFNYQFPEIPKHRIIIYTVLFTAIPGIPYTVKNYILALSGISRTMFFVIVLPIHIIEGIPVVVLGEAVISFNPLFTIILICALLAVNLILYRIQGTIKNQD